MRRGLRPFIKIAALAALFQCSLGGYDQHWRLAEQYQRQGQSRKAIEEYSRLVTLGGRNKLAIQAQLEIAQIYEKDLKKFDLAVRAYRDVVKRSDDVRVQTKSRIQIARIYQERLELPIDAASEYQAIVKDLGDQAPESAELYQLLAKCLVDGGRLSDAITVADKFELTYPTHPDLIKVLVLKAQTLLADRQLERARDLYRDVIQKLSTGSIAGASLGVLGEAYYGLGSSLEQLGDTQSALDAYKQSLVLYPNRKVIETKIERVLKRIQERKI
jgi:tetratricopeptide (TPR) repeat protein